VQVGDCRLTQGPLIPHLMCCPSSPHVNCDRLPSCYIHGILEREEDWEPAEHVGCVGGRVCVECDIFVKHRLKIAHQAVDDPRAIRCFPLKG
jgi:hypothetical protein